MGLITVATSFKERSMHMSIMFAIICVLGSAATIIFLSTLGIGGWFKAAIIVPVVLLAVYSMARIPPKEPEAEKIPTVAAAEIAAAENNAQRTRGGKGTGKEQVADILVEV
jgi:hypothetical protein